jgi:hypothetical protein
MSFGADTKRLSWMQRVALIRHNLHAACRTTDFTFFKALQASAFLESTDYVAMLTILMRDEADTILHGLDDLNAGLAYVHQDAFKNIYDNIRSSIAEEDGPRRAKTRVDLSQQKQITEFGIAKMVNAAIALIEQQPSHCQEAVANVWIIGATIMADSIQTCILQMDKLEYMLDDFLLLEYSWQMVQTAVEASVSALRGVFSLMGTSDTSVSPTTGAVGSRAASISSNASSFIRRLSTVLTHSTAPPAPPSSARSSINMGLVNTDVMRNSISAACPVAMPAMPAPPKRASHDPITFQRKLSTIPPTPFGMGDVNPFEMSFNSNGSTQYGIGDPMHEDTSPSPLEGDPLGTPLASPDASGDCKTWTGPVHTRRISTAFQANPISV